MFILCTAFQCDDEPLEGEFLTDDAAACLEATNVTLDAALAFFNTTDENYTEICNAYKDALEARIIVCGDEDGSLQQLIDELGDCVLDNQDTCQEAVAAKNEAETAFNNSTDVNYTALCNALKDAIQNVIDTCGETQELQDQIIGLGNCILTGDPTNELIGTWLLTAWIGEEPIDLNNDGTENVNFLEEMDCYNEETLVFNDDGTGASVSTSFAEIEIFLEIGTTNQVDFNVTCIDEDSTTDFTWTQTDMTVTITDVFGTNDWTLDGNTLSILIPEGFSVINVDDATVNTIQDLTFVYTKQ
ncbi:MAG: hypothetical protein ED556_06905 [Winogradskyella sp.]|nr:MAG: hypothetical protein ED556_06905 [Winogradskyella sp.]